MKENLKETILWFHLILFVLIFVDWQKLRCSLTFEFVHLIYVLANDFSCTKFHGFIEPTKTTKISIQQIRMILS